MMSSFEREKLGERLLGLKASRAGTLAFLTKTENQFKALLLAPSPGMEVVITKTKAVFHKALEAALEACKRVISAIPDESVEYSCEKEEAIARFSEIQAKRESINGLYEGFMQSLFEVASTANGVDNQCHVLVVAAPESCNGSTFSRQAREAELLKERAERARVQAELEKKEAALSLEEVTQEASLAVARAKIEQQRLKLQAPRKVATAEAAAVEASINAQYVIICGSEVDVLSRILPIADVSLTHAKLPAPTPRPTPPQPSVKPSFSSEFKRISPLDAHKQVALEDITGVPKANKEQLSKFESSDIAQALAHSSLPKLSAQTFDGNLLEYHQFIRGFESLFKFVKDPELKFQYVVNCCRGKAYQVIKSCSKVQPASRAYQLAKEKLEHKFGRLQNIIDAHLARVADGPPIKADDINGLDQLAFDMENCYVTVAEWKGEHVLNNSKTLVKILDRLPKRLQLRFHERCADLYDNNDEPTFAHLMKFLANTVHMADSRLGKKLFVKGCKGQATSVDVKSFVRSAPVRATAFAAQSRAAADAPSGNANTVIECYKCKQNYALWQGFPNFFMNVPLKQFQKLTVPLQHKIYR